MEQIVELVIELQESVGWINRIVNIFIEFSYRLDLMLSLRKFEDESRGDIYQILMRDE